MRCAVTPQHPPAVCRGCGCRDEQSELFTLGIPCIYYGSEQAFAGTAQSQLRYLTDEGWNQSDNFPDRYLREAMFGPEHPRASHREPLDTQLAERNVSLPGFGPLGTAGQHLFDQDSPSYVQIAAMCAIRQHTPCYASAGNIPGKSNCRTPISFSLPPGRLLPGREFSTSSRPWWLHRARGGDVVVAAELSSPGTQHMVVANTAEAAAGPNGYTGSHPVGETHTAKGLAAPGEPAFVEIRDLMPAEVVVLLRA